VVGFLLRLFKQPSLVTYIIVGVLVGPFGFGLVTDEALITNLGSFGLILLLILYRHGNTSPGSYNQLEGIRFRNLNTNSGQRRCSLAIGPVFQLENKSGCDAGICNKSEQHSRNR
jgi:hypothetical protein